MDIIYIKNISDKILIIKKKLYLLKKNIKFYKKKKLISYFFKKNIYKKYYNLWIKQINIYKKLNISLTKIKIMISIMIDINDYDINLINEINIKLNNLIKKIYLFKLKNYFYKKSDNLNCYLEIHSGSGGIDAHNWTKMLFKMYTNWIINHKYKLSIINKNIDNYLGIKNVIIKIEGKYAYGFLKYETGIHRLIRFSILKKKHKKQTSFSSVYIYPIYNSNKTINLINIKDIKIDTFKSSGAGGQHVNTTNSAVRITHLPTGIITQNQNSRSQYENKKQALKQLENKLYMLNNNIINKKKKKKDSISWSYQKRSYFLNKSNVVDNKINIISNNIDKILNGEINIFLIKYLELRLKKKINKYYFKYIKNE